MENELMGHQNLKAFKQHGFTPVHPSGNQVVGDCLFCGKREKLYVNPESKMWDCKSCGESGGFQTWLKAVVELGQLHFKGKPALDLSKRRSVRVDTLKAVGFGYNPHTGKYSLPVIDGASEHLWDVRIYDMKKFMSTTGCAVGLWGWERIKESRGRIWICEGEGDRLALLEMLEKAGIADDVAVAVPGAGTLKNEWNPYFQGRNVVALYDADEPGKKGARKCFDQLHGLAKSLKFVHWGDVPDGYDTADFWKANKATRNPIEKLEALLKEEPDSIGLDMVPEEKKKTKNQPIKYEGDYVPYDQVLDVYRKWLHLPSVDSIDITLGCVIANRFANEPSWLFLIGEPSCGKTVLINSISEAQGIVAVSTLTPQSLVSGANLSGGSDPSLIPMLDQKVLVVKDFTVVLNMPQTNREEIFGILRDAYDGSISKTFGNGVRRNYVSKFGIIAGVTPAIERFTEENSTLGERFLGFRFPVFKMLNDRLEFIQKAQESAKNSQQMKKELLDIGTKVLSFDYLGKIGIPELSEDQNLQVAGIAEFIAHGRTSVSRNSFSGNVEYHPFTEMATRLVAQLTNLLQGIALLKGRKKIIADDIRLLKKLALGSVPLKYSTLIEKLWKNGPENWLGLEVLHQGSKISKTNLQRNLEDLSLIGILELQKTTGLDAYSYKLTENMAEIIELGEIYE